MPRSFYTFNTYVSQEFRTPSMKIVLYKLFLTCNVLERQRASSAYAFVSTGLNSVGYQRFVNYLPVDTASYSGCNLKGLLYIKVTACRWPYKKPKHVAAVIF
jgi:hypothetical protein